jgi:hypothetical protein
MVIDTGENVSSPKATRGLPLRQMEFITPEEMPAKGSRNQRCDWRCIAAIDGVHRPELSRWLSERPASE